MKLVQGAKRKPLTFEIADGPDPVFLRIAATLVGEIQRGRLRSGMLLPGTRELAKQLGVHRNTVCAAFNELVSQGWAVSKKRQGTFVANSLPQVVRVGTSTRARDIPDDAASEIDFRDTLPASPWFPSTEFAASFRSALVGEAQGREHVYPDGLREVLAELLGASRGLVIGSDNLLITRSAQMNLFVAARYLSKHTASIFVEEPGSPAAWSAFRAAGLTPIAVRVDRHGMDPDRLSAAMRKHAARALYITPSCQFPTTVDLAANRKARLLSVAQKGGLTILEDDHANDFCGGDSLPLPLAAHPDSDQIIYMGSFGNLLQRGLGIGYLSAPPKTIAEIAEIQLTIDDAVSAGFQGAIAEILKSGDLIRYARKIRREMGERRQLSSTLLIDTFGDRIDVKTPNAGSAIWMDMFSGPDMDMLRAQSLRLGLRLGDTSAYYFQARPHAFRLGVGNLAVSEIAKAVRRFKLADIVSRCASSPNWDLDC